MIIYNNKYHNNLPQNTKSYWNKCHLIYTVSMACHHYITHMPNKHNHVNVEILLRLKNHDSNKYNLFISNLTLCFSTCMAICNRQVVTVEEDPTCPSLFAFFEVPRGTSVEPPIFCEPPAASPRTELSCPKWDPNPSGGEPTISVRALRTTEPRKHLAQDRSDSHNRSRSLHRKQ